MAYTRNHLAIVTLRGGRSDAVCPRLTKARDASETAVTRRAGTPDRTAPFALHRGSRQPTERLEWLATLPRRTHVTTRPVAPI